MAGTVQILHLTDLHLGAGELRDEDMKITIPGAERAPLIDRLASYLRQLDQCPDYVCATGDFTNAGRADGFQRFREWVAPLITERVLPPPERILITPGNHDVSRSPGEPEERFRGFLELARVFPHAYLPHVDPQLPDPKFPGRNAAHAGGLSTRTRMGQVEITESEPYLLDRDRGVLFFAFNSSLACGVYPDESQELLDRMSAARKLAEGEPALAKTLDALRVEAASTLLLDAGLVGEEQISYFQKLMTRLRDGLGDIEWARITKVALLHHHLNPVWRQQLELKPFESIIDSAQVKLALTEFGFDLVLHGHKHQNGVAIDTQVLPRLGAKGLNPVCVISGGTVCGYPALGDRQTFKVLSLEPGPNRQAAILEEYPLPAASDPRQVMSEERVVYRLPLADRIPNLHDDPALKQAIDTKLLEEALADQDMPYTARVDDVEIQWPGDGALVSEDGRYRFRSMVERRSERVYFEVVIATERLDFRQRARIHWMLVDVKRQAEALSHKARVVLLIADMSETHFCRELEPGEVRASIAKLEQSFAPAIQHGLLTIVTRPMTQAEVSQADRAIGPGDRYEA